MDLLFSTSVLGDRQFDREPTDRKDKMLNFTRTMKTGGWLSSFTANVGRGEPRNPEQSQKIGASANFKSVENDALRIDITAKVVRNRNSKQDRGNRDIDRRLKLKTGRKMLGATSRDGLMTLKRHHCAKRSVLFYPK